MNNTTLQESIARARAKLAEDAAKKAGTFGQQKIAAAQVAKDVIVQAAYKGVELNKEQQSAVDRVLAGESFCFIGSAGTGKTTTTKAMVHSLMQSNKIPMLERGTKRLKQNSPGIVLIAYTRRAVRNIAKQMSDDFKPHCMTFHALVEYEPEVVETPLPDGKIKITKPFLPQRKPGNTLPANLKYVLIDEASMFSIDYFTTLRRALPNGGDGVIFVYIGDINQLPPIYGDGVLGLQMNRLPTIELTQVYRQALESPIIKYALMIKDNKLPSEMFALTKDYVEETAAGKVSFIPWKKKLDTEEAGMAINLKLAAWVNDGTLNFDTDVILCPWGKSFGTIEMNKAIGTALARKNQREVYEVIAGYQKHYLSVGDKVMVNKMDMTITKITRNAKYLGKTPQPSSLTMDYWGWGGTGSAIHEDVNIDDLLEAFADMAEVTDRVEQASHIITLKYPGATEEDGETTITTSSEINGMELAYAMSVHKSQGSEWERVFLITHDTHSKMLQRELVYTAFTRASKELTVIMSPTMLRKAAMNAKIKGNTLAEKIKWFKQRLEEKGSIFQKSGQQVEVQPEDEDDE